MSAAILVYAFDEAPDDLRALSDNGGDEDWIAVMPAGVSDLVKMHAENTWLGEGGPFGCCSVSRHDLPDGRTVYIGAHA